MKLNKLHPNELYQWWVITTLALQCHEAAATAASGGADSTSSDSKAEGAVTAAPAAGMGADKLLQLAEAMAARLLSKHTGCCPPSWESVMMYLGLLQAQVGEGGTQVQHGGRGAWLPACTASKIASESNLRQQQLRAAKKCCNHCKFAVLQQIQHRKLYLLCRANMMLRLPP